MKKIAIIGAGQLGSRHLQGIAQCSFDISIEVVEPFELSRQTAKERYEEIKNNNFVKRIDFFDSIEKLSSELDLVIMATNADVRSKVIQELLLSKNVDNLVLEKVLFQTIKEYDEVEKLLKETKTVCWVNHPRRMLPFYHRLKEVFKDSKQLMYTVNGGAWGIGCNALHYIDHLAFLVDSEDLTVSAQLLDDRLYDSKRKGFVEFNGLLAGKISNHCFSLYAHPERTVTSFSICSEKISIKIDESKGEMEIAKEKDGWIWKKEKEKIIYFQSELSQVLAEDILIHKNTSLPAYAQAKALHVPFIEALLDKMEQITGSKQDVCSIT